MLDITLLRTQPDVVKKNLEKRNQSDKIKWVDELLKLDEEWRTTIQAAETLRHERNTITLEITKLSKAKKNPADLIKKAKTIPAHIKKHEETAAALREKIDHYLMRLPNMLDPSVPFGKTEKDNTVLRTWGKKQTFPFPLQSHVELIEKLHLGDFDAGRLVAGQGFNYLTGGMALLDHALQRYGVDFLLQRGFTPVVPPMMLNRETLSGAVDLSAFEDVIYKIDNEDLYLIGTAEHALVSMMRGKTVEGKDLPLKFCAVTPCFRKEIGGHGVDMKGIFRMHQFNKVEQVVYTTPENALTLLDEMQAISEAFFQSLTIPYRVLAICSGDIGNKMAKQHDIEAWFPRQDEYREVTSCGSCSDYQARRLNIKYTNKGERSFVHILNNTMVATSRAMVAILENYQQKDGSVKIPDALQPYMHGLKKLSLTK